MSDHHPHTPEPVEHADAWHRHTPAEGVPQHEHGTRVNPAFVGVVLLGIVFFTLAFLFVVWGYFNSYSTRVKADKLEQVTTVLRGEYQGLRSTAESHLTGAPAWIDREAGTVRMPIDRAAALVVDEYAQPRGQTPSRAGSNGGPDA